MPPRNPLMYRLLSHPMELFRHVSLTTKNHASATLPVTHHFRFIARISPRSPNACSWNRVFSDRRLGSSQSASRPAVRAWSRQKTQALPRQRICRRFKSTRSDDGLSFSGSGNESLSQRLRKLFWEYGWSALGVYLLLSAVDFPFCFAAVRLFGTDRIGHLEHVIVGSVKDALSSLWPASRRTEVEGHRESKDYDENVDNEPEQGSGKDKKEKNTEQASIWAQLALAYAIHKSFIFIRVPLTAAVTPKIVKILRNWGWNIGKRKPKSS